MGVRKGSGRGNTGKLLRGEKGKGCANFAYLLCMCDLEQSEYFLYKLQLTFEQYFYIFKVKIITLSRS